ncbi:MAG: glycosyltransferase family 2 protein [Lachnospiraceae bacterium]|jgi:glycosyltransferase involved in cell wall biosynthesis|nr:glycosyltransferase family 2 protein [Lachnospiraceae bacterium]
MCQLSIIVPLYNASATLPACITSIRKQTLTDWELLLIDDGSTDMSAAICQEALQRDSRIHYYPLPHNGVSHARKTGISHAHGTFLCFVDADDVLHTTYAEAMVSEIIRSHADICICGYRTIKDGIITPYLPSESDSALASLFTDEGVEGFLWNKLYRRTLLTEDLFANDLHHCEDLYLNTLLLTNSNLRVCFLKETLYDYFQRDTSATHGPNFFPDGHTFSYAPAFEKLFAILIQQKTDNVYRLAVKKFETILTFSMYTALTTDAGTHSDVKRLQHTMRSYCGRIFKHADLSMREKLHYLFLTFAPLLYRAIRL